MFNVKRPFTPSFQKKRHDKPGMRSTINTDDAYVTPYRHDDRSKLPPSIEQIAMGLHVSRTPHIRPLSSSQRYPNTSKHLTYHFHGDGAHSPPLPPSRPTTASSSHHLPAPTRSSLKKSSTLTSSSSATNSPLPDLSAASVSSTTITSNTISTSRSSRSLSAFKSRMTRFFHGSRIVSAPATPSFHHSVYEDPKLVPPKKAVRFTGHIRDQEDQD